MALMELERGERVEAKAGFLRFSWFQRTQHWLLVASFLALLATGLPQKFNDNEVSIWFINTIGGIDRARFIHRIAASVFAVESVLHVSDIALSILRRRFRASMVITLRDFRDAFNMLRYSVGLTPEKPRFERYDYRQKFEYWGIVFGAIIMIATGLTLWFPTYVTRLFPGEFVAAAKEMHGGEALLALLVIVIWHLYDVVLSPAVFPLDLAMITGRISRHRLEEEHDLEYARLTGVEPLPLPLATPRPISPAAAPSVDGKRWAREPAAASPVRPARHRRPWTGLLRRSLQLRVMMLVGVGIAGILGAFSVSSFLAVNESIDRSLDERRALAGATAGHVDYALQEGLRVLEEATFVPGFNVTDSDQEPEQEALRSASASRIFTMVYLTDARGAIIWTEPFYPWAIGMGVDSQPHVSSALSSDKPTVSGLTAATAGGQPVVSMLAPVHDQSGALTGLIGGDIALNSPSLTDIIRPAVAGGATYAQIVDSEGAVLASTRDGDLLTKSDHEGQMGKLISAGSTVSGTCHGCHESAAGDERRTEVMAFAPLTSAPWGVVIRQPEDEALAPANRLRERAIWLGVPAFGLALLFAWVTARSVLRPVRVLTASAETIAAGNLTRPVPDLGEDEVGTLARAFETMRRRLKESLDSIQAWGHDLEERVEERTRELKASRDHLKTVAEENARLYQEVKQKEAARTYLLQKVMGAQEDERRRIARELHDETSQALTALVLGVEAAASESRPGQEGLSERLLDLRALAESTLDGVHRLVYDLRPSVLDDLGLVAGLRWYLETRLQPLGVDTDVIVTGEGRRLPGEVETALFRIGQEAISNVARHAQASRAVLSLAFSGGRITMQLEDDGRGFDTAGLDSVSADSSGWGIMGMQERAALLGGALSIDSRPGGGTRVHVTLPLSQSHDAQDPGAHSG